MGTSAGAASTYGKASVYGSASARVRLAPDEVFDPSAELLLERGDIEITNLDEAENRCTAVAGDRTVTFRVIDSGTGACRLSIQVGGGQDRVTNQRLADELLRSICGRLPVPCE
jgi:hypothetical protein